MPIFSPALEARKRAMQAAHDTQIKAAAAGGIKPTSAQEVEEARLRYREALGTALARYTGGLPGDKRGNNPLRPEEMAQLARESHGAAEVRRLEYDDVRDRYESQERRAAEARAVEATLANIEAAEEQAKAAVESANAAAQSAVHAKTMAAAADQQAAAAAESAVYAKKTADAADRQAAAASASTWIAFAVGAMILFQTFAFAGQTYFMARQYNLQKWQADHPQNPIACVEQSPGSPPGPNDRHAK